MPKGRYPREVRFPHKVNVGMSEAMMSDLISAANADKVPLGTMVRRLVEKPLANLLDAQRKRAGRRPGHSADTDAR